MTNRTPPITIRKAEPGDAPKIVAFQQAMAMETEGKTLNAATVEAGVDGIFGSPDKGFYIVAEIGGAVVGSLMITYEWSDWRNATFWWIQGVFVNTGHRRRGVYTAMHNRVLALAETDGGVCGVRLYVERGNAPAQATYKSLGMDHSHYDLYEIDFVL